ncbi:NADH-quinone oxidoreductase subunit J [Bartonella sp. TP]|uniref:NADH-quinone oxidoreductase subunit J n=1 Tax=Bartonella sp. TP TaxID=3057550 RepID=UPI0025B1A1AB|nr:NADH-quinone oxidoreductase subunit J [Bartonella sp. TP]MDN5248909.1 NADH-quinone oxidoreductase subunit J [Alphaproteobacteria bacterium]WJW79934.1 NADH-quinone oxidoreductase subunit J [Bartonella sp. TP]
MLVNIVNILFWVFSSILLLSALLVILARNPVHSVLFLILAFFNAAALFLLTGAEFLAFILLIVYVGAVAVLFLFVVMMLNIDFAEMRARITRYSSLGLVVTAIMLAELLASFTGYNFAKHIGPNSFNPISHANVSNTQLLGDILYTKYAFYFELSGLVLLIAMIASIVLTLHHRPNVKRQNIAEQVARSRENAIEIKKVQSGKGI